jgi:hypothetical protein
VPQAAVRSETNETFVFVLKDGDEPERRRVALGPQHGGLRVVKDGLAADDWVVLDRAFAAQRGEAVAPFKVSLLHEGDAGKARQVRATLDLGYFRDHEPAAHPPTVLVKDNGLSVRLPLQHASAAEVVRLAAKLMSREQLKGRLTVTADDQTNTLFVEGPTDPVLELVKLVAGLEELGRRNPKPVVGLLYDDVNSVLVKSALRGFGGARSGDGPRLGVSVETVSPPLAEQLNLSAGVGLLVTEVVAGSPAAKVGVRVNDVLVKIDGAAVPADKADFVKLIASLKSDTPLDVVVVRRGQRQNLGPVRLADGPAPADKQRTQPGRTRRDEIKARIDALASDVDRMKERVAWSERMFKKGYLTEQQVEADRALLRKTEAALEKARQEVKTEAP